VNNVELENWKKRAEWLRESAALLSGIASTIDLFVLALEAGNIDEAAIHGEALRKQQPQLEALQMAGDVFRFEVKL
jgi:hypothetical protein